MQFEIRSRAGSPFRQQERCQPEMRLFSASQFKPQLTVVYVLNPEISNCEQCCALQHDADKCVSNASQLEGNAASLQLTHSLREKDLVNIFQVCHIAVFYASNACVQNIC